MKLKRIDYKNGHLWVDTISKPTMGDICYDPFSNTWGMNGNSYNPENLKIIGQTNLNIPNIPFVEIDNDDSITEIAKEDASFRFGEIGREDEWLASSFAYIRGYKSAKEKYAYTEEDLRRAIDFGNKGMYGYRMGEEGLTVNQVNKYIQSLSQLPDEIEIEVKEAGIPTGQDIQYYYEPKTFTKEGKTFLIVKSR